MATTTVSGSTVTFSNSGAAANLSQTGTEDGALAFTFDVLAASGGGKNTTIYSVDDGAVDTVYSGALSNNSKLMTLICSLRTLVRFVATRRRCQ